MFLKMWRQQWRVKRFLLEYDTPDHFTRSCWQKKERVTPVWIAYRSVLVLYFAATFAYMCFSGDKSVEKSKIFIYVSNWSYTIETITFILSFAIVIEKFIEERESKKLGRLVIRTGMPWHYKMLWVLYTISCTASIVVSMVFWIFIHTKEKYPNHFRTLIIHGGNSLLMLTDFFLGANPIQFLHFYIPLLYSFVYALFTVIYQESGGTGSNNQIPIYEILDWRETDKAVFTCSLCFLGSLGVHVLYSLFNMLKLWLKDTPENLG